VVEAVDGPEGAGDGGGALSSARAGITVKALVSAIKTIIIE
jgi:hypothetical protein